MRRNIIKQGNNSFTLTMPIKWIRDNNLDGGDEVIIAEEDNDVIVSLSDKKPLETTVVVNLKQYSERSIKNIIFQLYRKGYDKISCSINDNNQKEIVKRIVRENLLGFEVIAEKDNKLTIENVAEPSKEKFNSLLNKLFFIIKSNALDIISDLSKNCYSNEQNYLESKNLFDVYTNFLRRIIIKERLSGTKDSYLLFYFISQLSYIQHSFFYSYKFCSKNNLKIDKYSLDKIEELLSMTNLLYESFSTKDVDKAHLLTEKYLALNEELMLKIDKSTTKNKSILCHVIIGIRYIQLATTVIFGLCEYSS